MFNAQQLFVSNLGDGRATGRVFIVLMGQLPYFARRAFMREDRVTLHNSGSTLWSGVLSLGFDGYLHVGPWLQANLAPILVS
jgi:hypothetical protein